MFFFCIVFFFSSAQDLTELVSSMMVHFYRKPFNWHKLSVKLCRPSLFSFFTQTVQLFRIQNIPFLVYASRISLRKGGSYQFKHKSIIFGQYADIMAASVSLLVFVTFIKNRCRLKMLQCLLPGFKYILKLMYTLIPKAETGLILVTYRPDFKKYCSKWAQPNVIVINSSETKLSYRLLRTGLDFHSVFQKVPEQRCSFERHSLFVTNRRTHLINGILPLKMSPHQWATYATLSAPNLIQYNKTW